MIVSWKQVTVLGGAASAAIAVFTLWKTLDLPLFVMSTQFDREITRLKWERRADVREVLSLQLRFIEIQRTNARNALADLRWQHKSAKDDRDRVRLEGSIREAEDRVTVLDQERDEVRRRLSAL